MIVNMFWSGAINVVVPPVSIYGVVTCTSIIIVGYDENTTPATDPADVISHSLVAILCSLQRQSCHDSDDGTRRAAVGATGQREEEARRSTASTSL